MTLQQFIAKYNGKYLDYDKAYGAQCVDVTKAYYKEVLGIAPKMGNAIDYWYSIDPRFIRIANTPTNSPKPGDILVFGKSYGYYGHVAVVTSANVWNVQGFEQNNPLGSPCTYRNHYMYRGVLGWLRKR